MVTGKLTCKGALCTRCAHTVQTRPLIVVIPIFLLLVKGKRAVNDSRVSVGVCVCVCECHPHQYLTSALQNPMASSS